MADQLRMTNIKPRESAMEQRKTSRIRMALPIQISGQDAPESKWQELSRVIEVSPTGASFHLKHAVPPGLILHLSFPLPWKLRQHGHAEPSYKIYAVVRSISPQPNHEFRMGVEFIGETPPSSYHTHPWTLYASVEWRGEERRQAERKKVSQLLWVEYYDSQNHLLAVEQGSTENLSQNGARLCVQDPPVTFAHIKVFDLGQGFESRAKVVRQFLGKDGFYRLCVQFTEKQWNRSE